MAPSKSFLASRTGSRPWQLPEGGRATFETESLFLGRGQHPLEVCVARAARQPNVSDIRTLWERRQGNRPSPLLLIITFDGSDGLRAIACGAVGERPPVTPPLDPGQLERIAEAALDEPGRNAAIRLLNAALPDAQSDLPGVRNAGMFATHELKVGVLLRPDWSAAAEVARSNLSKRGRDLVEALGFSIEQRGTAASLLRSGDTASALAIFLEEGETPEGPSTRFNGLSPVSHAFAEADKDRLPYVIVTRGPEIRVYATSPDVGVGRKGRAETYLGLNLSLLPDHLAGYLALLFGAEALQPGGSFEQILERCKDYSTDLGKRLRERVYDDVIPTLAEAIADRVEFQEEPTDADLDFLYQMALILLFRLLFIAYAEDKDVLPYRRNGMYARWALKTLARDLTDKKLSGDEEFDAAATSYWQHIQSLFRAVCDGNSDWGVPPYDGGLFSSDDKINEAGAELDRIELTNAELGPALQALLVDIGDEGVPGPVDFRSLSVREFGTIYEGLLESNLSIASSDLTVDRNGAFVPTKKREEIWVEEGAIYLHNRSGARKSSGSYFTKPFAVEHLLDHALEPALDTHLERISELLADGRDSDAADAFFDFRCADIAMGSGHFLVAAVDRIEARMSSFLAANPMPRVIKELDMLRTAAYEQLGDLGEGVDIEHSSLLRRLVGRRCIYGADINRIAVELARLGVWIHTFVPGLPLSFLDHNLAHGNSLTGIGTIEEAERILDPSLDPGGGTISLFHDQIVEWLDRARSHLKRLATISEASIAEVKEARAEHLKAMKSVQSARDLFDLLVGVRLGEAEALVELTDAKVENHKDLSASREIANDELAVLHFPIAFPEVFLRERAGFDCVVGNPPWDKVRFEAQQFWVGRWPGLNSLNAKARDAEIARLRKRYPDEAQLEATEQIERERMQQLFGVAYRHLGRGHYDFAKVFGERATDLLGKGGHLGYVLPRQALVLGGWSVLRERLIADHAARAVQVRNKAGWLFEDVDHRFMMVLLSWGPVDDDGSGVRIWPSLTSLTELVAATEANSLWLSEAELHALSDSWVVPWFNGLGDVPVFEKLKAGPRVGSDDAWVGVVPESFWDFSSTGRHRDFVGDDCDGAWGVLMARHVDPYRIAIEDAFQRSLPSPSDLVALKLGVEGGSDGVVLGSAHPSLVFRYPSINDNARTMIATALPASGYLPSKGYSHTMRPGPDDLVTRLALLGYLNSYTCDWWVRRFVDRHVTNPVVMNLPLPSWTSEQRSDVARLVAALLRGGGTEVLVGHEVIGDLAEPVEEGDEETLAVIEGIVAAGFGLSATDMSAMLVDFTDSGCSRAQRQAIYGVMS
ncbi:MAG: hypothetical protein WD556_10995 [Actinomycetota bacterium]